MKLDTIAIEQRPSKTVQLKLASREEPYELQIQLLTVQDRMAAHRDAMVDAKSYGKDKWDELDPVCSLALYVQVVTRAVVDPDDGKPFATADQLRSNLLIGQENILYLYEQYEAFEESQNLRLKTLTREELLGICWRLAEGDESFLERMRLGMLRACLRFTASQYIGLLMVKSRSSSDESQEQEQSSKAPTTS
jgi:hypothetical protein